MSLITIHQAETASLKTVDDAMTELWHHQKSFEIGYYTGRMEALAEAQWSRDRYYTKKPMGLRPDPYSTKPPRTAEFYKLRRLGRILRRRFKNGT